VQKGEPLKIGMMIEIMKDNPDALALMKLAKTNNNAAIFFGAAGGLVLGFSLGVAIDEGEPIWVLTAAGAGMILMTAPLIAGVNRNSIAAVQIYNSDLKDLSSKTNYELKFGINSCGVGLSLRF
jgi:hypothetical protein